MDYVVYCDESRHISNTRNTFMSIGGLWLPRAEKRDLTRRFRNLRHDLKIGSEIKWSKVSDKYLERYKQVVDFFFQETAFHFRVIVVEHEKVRVDEFHNGDHDLGFYKFYYQMLTKWIIAGNGYLVLLDFKANKDTTHRKELHKALIENAPPNVHLSDVTVIDSRLSPLAQLCDVLTGAVAASYCNAISGSKAELAAYIADRCGWKTLRCQSTSPAICKFNIFCIDLDLR